MARNVRLLMSARASRKIAKNAIYRGLGAAFLAISIFLNQIPISQCYFTQIQHTTSLLPILITIVKIKRSVLLYAVLFTELCVPFYCDLIGSKVDFLLGMQLC